jgi:hypothetical protein
MSSIPEFIPEPCAVDSIHIDGILGCHTLLRGCEENISKAEEIDDWYDLSSRRAPKLTCISTVNFAMKLFWKDFAGDFEWSLNNFRNHIKNVEKEVGIASMIEVSDERALVRVDRVERDKAKQGELLKMLSTENNRIDVLAVAERDLILSKLSPIKYIDKHLRERRKRHPGSGSWLRETVEFKDWVIADRSAGLWCYGIRKSEVATLSQEEYILTLECP